MLLNDVMKLQNKLVKQMWLKAHRKHLCGGAGKGGNCRILKKMSYSVIIKIDPFCHIMHLKFLIYLK